MRGRGVKCVWACFIQSFLVSIHRIASRASGWWRWEGAATRVRVSSSHSGDLQGARPLRNSVRVLAGS